MPNEYAYGYEGVERVPKSVGVSTASFVQTSWWLDVCVMKRDVIQRFMVCTARIAAQPLELHTGRRGRAGTA